VNFQDGNQPGKLGDSLPPKYKRDPTTGKFTGEEEKAVTPEEKKILKMDPVEEQEYLLRKVYDDWDLSEKDEETGAPKKLSELAERIRYDNMAMNTLGRSVESQAMKPKLDDGDDGYVDKTGFSKPLSPSEFKAFRKYLKDEYGMDVNESDIPVEPFEERDTTSLFDGHTDDENLTSRVVDGNESDIPVDPFKEQGSTSLFDGYADNEYLNEKWMSSRAARFMDDSKDDDPFSDLLPSDFSPTRLVSRRNAKKIPRELLHHNNLALLRRYITPTGQIMNRVQSRLGAKDQRKVAKMIRRARAIGLLPTAGQFAIESHGNIYEDDIHEDREWEKELKRRGLVVSQPSQK